MKIIIFYNIILIAVQLNISLGIINGFKAIKNQFPWHVYIRAQFQSGGGEKICNGVIISNSTVLSSANCLVGSESVYLGFGSIDRKSPLILMQSFHYNIHPNYNNSNYLNNLVVIHLPIELSFTKMINRIRIAINDGENFESEFVTETGYLSGIGRLNYNLDISNNLNYGIVKVIPLKKCVNFFGKQKITERNLCIDGNNVNHGKNQVACLGDWGGPLIVRDRFNYLLIGLVSFISDNQCSLTDPTAITRIDKYLNWIENLKSNV